MGSMRTRRGSKRVRAAWASRLWPACLLAVLAACTGPREDAGEVRGSAPIDANGQPRERTPSPWTDAFAGHGMLLATNIRIEGPDGLLEHVVIRADDSLYERSVLTTSEGFLQITRSRAPGTDLVRGQIDGWQIAAYDAVHVLERPGATQVVVTAEGDAVFQDTLGGEERSGRLVFVGALQE